MKKILSVLLALVLLLALAAPALAEDGMEEAQITGTFCYAAARAELELVNDFRTGSEAWFWNSDDTTKTQYAPGELGKLRIDPALEQIAMERARELALSFSHTRPNGERCFSLTVDGMQSWGENIAYGYATPEAVFTAWREDDDPYAGQGHRRNMLGSGYVAVGFGCFLHRGIYYWAQEFSYYDSGAELPAHSDEEATGPVTYSTAIFGAGYWSDEGNCPAAYYTPPEPAPEPEPDPIPEQPEEPAEPEEPTEPEEPDPTPTADEDFVIDKDGTLKQYCGAGGEVAIPETVTRIGESAFDGCEALTAVTIPDGVTYIGKYAFRGCAGLTSVTIPDGVTGVGTAAFSGCTALGFAMIGGSAGFIGDHAFADCTALEYVMIGGADDEAARHIGDNCFSGCAALKEITIPINVVSIGDNAFLGCDALTAVWYGGNRAEWLSVKIDPAGNDALAAAEINCLGRIVFEDVDENAYFATAVNWAVEIGVTNGKKEDKATGQVWFKPGDAVKRGEAVTFLWRAFGKPEPETEENRFQDLTQDYYRDAILWAVEKGITNGTKWDEEAGVFEFSPETPVTRAQMLTFLWRAFGKPGYEGEGLGGYADAEYWAHEVGALGDIESSYTGDAPCPRSDVVYYLFNAVLLGGFGGGPEAE